MLLSGFYVPFYSIEDVFAWQGLHCQNLHSERQKVWLNFFEKSDVSRWGGCVHQSVEDDYLCVSVEIAILLCQGLVERVCYGSDPTITIQVFWADKICSGQSLNISSAPSLPSDAPVQYRHCPYLHLMPWVILSASRASSESTKLLMSTSIGKFQPGSWHTIARIFSSFIYSFQNFG